MTRLENEILQSVYDYYQDTNSRQAQLDYPRDNKEKSQYLKAISNLVDDGYIEELHGAIGFVELEITPWGISYLENN